MNTLLLTPTLHGDDGLSCLSRQLRDALSRASRDSVETMTLAPSGAPPGGARCAAGPASMWANELAFAAQVLHRAIVGAPPAVTLVAHLHLLPAVWPLLLRGVPVVPVLVGIESWSPLPTRRRLPLRQLRHALAISHWTADSFRRHRPDRDELRIDVCWPATPELVPASDTTPAPPTPFALMVGRLAAEERYKGHDEMIDAWPLVRARVPAATLVVAGTGDDLPRVRQRVRESGLEQAIIFVDHVDRERLAALYQQCAFFALPSRGEGFGYVLLEAMSAARACLAAPGAAEEIVQPEVTGVIVDPSSRQGLADRLADLFLDPARCARLGAAGQQRAATVFSMDRFSRDLARALAPYLAQHPLRAAAEC